MFSSNFKMKAQTTDIRSSKHQNCNLNVEDIKLQLLKTLMVRKENPLWRAICL